MGRLSLTCLWAYCTSRHISKEATPFNLVYGVDAVVLIEVIVDVGNYGHLNDSLGFRECDENKNGRRCHQAIKIV